MELLPTLKQICEKKSSSDLAGFHRNLVRFRPEPDLPTPVRLLTSFFCVFTCLVSFYVSTVPQVECPEAVAYLVKVHIEVTGLCAGHFPVNLFHVDRADLVSVSVWPSLAWNRGLLPFTACLPDLCPRLCLNPQLPGLPVIGGWVLNTFGHKKTSDYKFATVCHWIVLCQDGRNQGSWQILKKTVGTVSLLCNVVTFIPILHHFALADVWHRVRQAQCNYNSLPTNVEKNCC